MTLNHFSSEQAYLSEALVTESSGHVANLALAVFCGVVAVGCTALALDYRGLAERLFFRRMDKMLGGKRLAAFNRRNGDIVFCVMALAYGVMAVVSVTRAFA